MSPKHGLNIVSLGGTPVSMEHGLLVARQTRFISKQTQWTNCYNPYLDEVVLFEFEQVQLERGPLALPELNGASQTTQLPNL